MLITSNKVGILPPDFKLTRASLPLLILPLSSVFMVYLRYLYNSPNKSLL